MKFTLFFRFYPNVQNCAMYKIMILKNFSLYDCKSFHNLIGFINNFSNGFCIGWEEDIAKKNEPAAVFLQPALSYKILNSLWLNERHSDWRKYLMIIQVIFIVKYQ